MSKQKYFLASATLHPVQDRLGRVGNCNIKRWAPMLQEAETLVNVETPGAAETGCVLLRDNGTTVLGSSLGSSEI
eukprot:5926687-Pleurochrysis_carterae.AAC.5